MITPHDACQECLGLLRSGGRGGNCPGLAPRRPQESISDRSDPRFPFCHRDPSGRLESPLEMDAAGGVRLVGGQERFYRFGLVQPEGPRLWGLVERSQGNANP